MNEGDMFDIGDYFDDVYAWHEDNPGHFKVDQPLQPIDETKKGRWMPAIGHVENGVPTYIRGFHSSQPNKPKVTWTTRLRNGVTDKWDEASEATSNLWDYYWGTADNVETPDDDFNSFDGGDPFIPKEPPMAVNEDFTDPYRNQTPTTDRTLRPSEIR